MTPERITMKEAMKRILTITDNHPPLGKEWLPSEAQAMCDGMQEIHVIALEATRAVPVERNADGDSLKKIKAVWKEFPAGGVEHDYIGCGQWWKTNETCGFAYTVDCYRITAKHADKFNPDCMSFEVWARAAIGRGMICRGVGKMDSTGIVKTCDCDNIDGAGMWASSDGHCWPFYANGASWTWTAIPRAAPDAGKPTQATEEYLAGISIAEPREDTPEPKVRTATLDGYRETAKRIGKRHTPQADAAGEGESKLVSEDPKEG